VIPPAEFIPLAEERGLIGRIDSFVLDEACRQLAAWADAGDVPDDFAISVNVSGRQLRDRGLVDRVAAALERHKIAPARLCVEITETALIGELGDANRVLESLSRLGVRLALDDFGTGYSTLAHLQQLRADILKIDRSFIAQLGRGSRDRKIIGAVTAMAHALGMTVVGEGIETDNQLDSLVAMECDEGQGYVFAPPLEPAALVALRSSVGAGGAPKAAKTARARPAHAPARSADPA
jgi:EAL domain-containing protein (putative c-di-GMP-specific phosphodiesterase class I)